MTAGHKILMGRLLFVATLGLVAIGISAWSQQPDYPAEDAGDAPDHGRGRGGKLSGAAGEGLAVLDDKEVGAEGGEGGADAAGGGWEI